VDLLSDLVEIKAPAKVFWIRHSSVPLKREPGNLTCGWIPAWPETTPYNTLGRISVCFQNNTIPVVGQARQMGAPVIIKKSCTLQAGYGFVKV
jgi:hypothetical protein